jgi:hypothetical protein
MTFWYSWQTKFLARRRAHVLFGLGLSLTLLQTWIGPTWAESYRIPEQEVNCEILVVGGGLAGTATAYEALLAGRTVCLTEITDWIGGQISSQGTSALDERPTQRSKLFYSRGYLELRRRIQERYGILNPGACWVSESCFIPADGDRILMEMLQEAARRGKGQLKWFPSTVVKELSISDDQIRGAVAIQHRPASGAPPLNSLTLSQTIEDWYRYEDSRQFEKTLIRFLPQPSQSTQSRNPQHVQGAEWYVIDATETGELMALADVPYRLGIDARSYLEPSSSSETPDPYCTQGFTYPFAMAATADPQPQEMPAFYPQYEPYYSYELPRFANFNVVFTYRRIASRGDRDRSTDRYQVNPGDISMQNWTWGNDYRPGTSEDNLVYTREQLQATGQLNPGGWMGGLRTESLRKAEELAQGYFYWLTTGITDSQLGTGVKQPNPNNRYLRGLDSPMGTVHGLSKYPYMREGRRLIGRPAFGFPQGFAVWEIDISRRDYRDPYYQEALSPTTYRNLAIALAGLESTALVRGNEPITQATRRTRSTIYPDSVGIGHYAIDFHACMALHPPEAPGNYERPGERRGAGNAYPFQIPLRAMIPQGLNNMLVVGKGIATSHIAAAAYRVHSYEWSSGAAAANIAAFALERKIFPYQLVDDLPAREPELELLQQRLQQQGNPTAFPDTSIFNESWEGWQ